MKIITQKQTEQCQIILAKQLTDLPEKIQSFSKKYFDKKENQVLFFANEPISFVAVLHLEETDSANKETENWRILGHQALQIIENEAFENVNLVWKTSEEHALAFLEGMQLSRYFFDKYKSTKKEKQSVCIGVEGIDPLKINELQNIISSVNTARTLVNEPVSYLNSVVFSQEITSLGKEFGFEVEVLGKKEIENLKMGGLLGVNKGSEIPPTFNILTWKPQNATNEKPFVLVGKGVVYDTGGYNVKPGAYMDEMKSDMAGAAAVVGTLCAVAKNKLPLYVVGLIPSTDNRINSNAIVSDDILMMMNGLSVEVKNTDAEGRLILADALAYAQKYDPKLVIDLATLTGAAARVTSHYGSALMGTASDEVKNELKNIGEQVYERLIEFPFWDEFDDDIKSPIADIKNLGNPEGGASTAGKFLQRFTQYPWLHIDIAGTAFLNKPYKYFKVGGTGVGIRLLYQFLKNQK